MEIGGRNRENFERNVSQGRVKFYSSKPALNQMKENDLAIYSDKGSNAYVLITKTGNSLIEWYSNTVQKGLNKVHTVAAGDKITIQNGVITKIE